MLLDNWLAQRALTSPDRLALAAEGRSLTYEELEGEATAAARRLGGLGARRGSAVALGLPAGVDYVILLHALMKAGAEAIPLDPRLGEDEVARALPGIRPALEVRSPEDASGHEADLPVLGELDLDATYCRILTSGTAGVPRPVGLTYGNHLWSAVGSAFNLGVQPGDRWLCCLPLFHVSGLSIVLRSAIYGTAVFVQDGFEAERVAASLAYDGVTVVSLVATALARLLEIDADVAAPRAILVGGGPVPAEVLEEATGRGATVVQTYGLTEAASQVATLAPEDAVRKLGSAGRPLLTTHLRIEDGEILVQGPTVAPGFADPDGWLHTGDVGRIDDEGFLWVEGRKGEVIVSGGENVAPEEVEEVLRRHPAVADAAVVGRPDAEWQEAVTAVVVVGDRAAADAEELARHCRQSLASYKVPKRFEFVAELPRTPAGKLARANLR
jgi:O-succinylbenzoic acid--CoA ligase